MTQNLLTKQQFNKYIFDLEEHGTDEEREILSNYFFNAVIERDALKAEVDALRVRKDGAYLERNKCVVLIVRMAVALGLKAGVAQHDPNDKEWEYDWRTVVYIDLPSGQISWHFHDSHKYLLAGLPKYNGTWDGHSTEIKYQRVLNPGF